MDIEFEDTEEYESAYENWYFDCGDEYCYDILTLGAHAAFRATIYYTKALRSWQESVVL